MSSEKREWWNKRIKIDEKSGCHIWQLSKTHKDGYGQVQINKVKKSAHRYAYEEKYGKIPEGKFICHTCDNPPCCNVDHLFLGSPKENSLDASKKGRLHNKNHFKTHCKHGHEFNEENTINYTHGKFKKRACRICQGKAVLRAYYKRKNSKVGVLETSRDAYKLMCEEMAGVFDKILIEVGTSTLTNKIASKALEKYNKMKENL